MANGGWGISLAGHVIKHTYCKPLSPFSPPSIHFLPLALKDMSSLHFPSIVIGLSCHFFCLEGLVTPVFPEDAYTLSFVLFYKVKTIQSVLAQPNVKMSPMKRKDFSFQWRPCAIGASFHNELSRRSGQHLGIWIRINLT